MGVGRAQTYCVELRAASKPFVANDTARMGHRVLPVLSQLCVGLEGHVTGRARNLWLRVLHYSMLILR